MKVINLVTVSDYILLLENYLLAINHDFPPTLLHRLKTLSDVDNFSDYAQKLTRKGIVLAAIENDKIVGIISFYVNDKKSKTAYITILSVLKAFKSTGIGTALLRDALSQIRSLGFSQVKVNTWSSNKAAIKLYTNFGFRVISESDSTLNFALGI